MQPSFYTRASEGGRSSSDPEYVSSSEQSCDTVIFVGKSRQMNGNRQPNGGNTPVTRAILKGPEDQNISDDQKKEVENSVLVQSSSDSILKSFRTKNEVAEIVDQSELGSQTSLKKDSEVSSESTCSEPSQPSVFEFKLCRGVATQLGTSKKNTDVRHDPLGDECHQNFQESAVSNSQTIVPLASCVSSGSEQVRCRVRKRHHPLPSNLVKQNELWVDGPNAVVAVQAAYKEDKNASDGVKEVLLDSLKPWTVNSMRLAKKPVVPLKEEKAGRAENAPVCGATEVAVTDNSNLEASTKQATGLVTCSGGMPARQEVKRHSEEAKKQVEEEGKEEGELLLQSVGMPISAKLVGSSEEAVNRGESVQQPSETLASSTNSGFFSEKNSPLSQQTESMNLRCQDDNASLLKKRLSLRALSKLSAAEANLTEKSPHSSPKESEVHKQQPVLDADSCDRTAQWVKNIQDASSSRFVQLLHSRKELLRSFRVRRNTHSISKAPTMDFIQSCQILATFDKPTDIDQLSCEGDSAINSGGESPIAGAKSALDINENEARLQENNREAHHSQCSGNRSVMTTYSTCQLRPNEHLSSKVGTDCPRREKGDRSASDKRALTECLRGTLLFCGRTSTALDRDEALHHVEESVKGVGRFDAACIVRLSQPDGASNPNIMDELHKRFSGEQPHMLQPRDNPQPIPFDQRKISSNPLVPPEKMGQAFHLDDKDTEEHSSFLTFHSSTSLINSKATFPLNLGTRRRSESVSCNMTANTSSSFVPSCPASSQHDSTIAIKSNSLQLTICDDAEDLGAGKSLSDEVIACSPRTVSTCSCHFGITTNAFHERSNLNDKTNSLPCCCEVPSGLAVSEIELHTRAGHEDCVEREGSDDSTFTLHLFRSLECHDQLSEFDVGRIIELPNQGKHLQTFCIVINFFIN